MKREFWITGIVPAVFTPMKKDGNLNLDKVIPIVEHLIDNGVAALYVCGSTGEGPSLTSEERMQVAEAYVAAIAGRIPVIVQVGHNSLRKARELAAHAGEIGANAISSIPPTYFKPNSVDVLLDCLVEITAGAPDLPFYYYHIPQITGVEMDMVEFLEKGAQRLASLHGIKYSTFSLFEFQACLDAVGGKFNMLFGSDEMLLAGLATGAHGAVGTTFNYAAPLYKRITAAVEDGDLENARRLQANSVKMVRIIEKYDPRAAHKGMMKIIGLDCGPNRFPQLTLSTEELDALKKDMDAIGFFEWGVETIS